MRWRSQACDLLQSQAFTSATAALASIAGHWFLIVAAIAALQPLPTEVEVGGPPRRLIATAWLIETPTTERSGLFSSADPPAFETEAITLPPPELPEIEAVAIGSFERTDALQGLADIAELERLQGVYQGQLRARLQRLMDEDWPLRPIWPRCRARVIQDEVGRVLDVDLDECAGDEETHAELARIIRVASPLPLPPDGLAMGSYLTLDLSTL